MTTRKQHARSHGDNNEYGCFDLRNESPVLYDGNAQIFTDVTTREIEYNGTVFYIQTQASQDDCLILNPNNVFFDDGAGFACTDDAGDGSALPDADMNQHRNYQTINGWKTVQAKLKWPVYFSHAGDLQLWVTLIANNTNVAENGHGATIEVTLENYFTGEEQIYISVVKENSAALHQQQWKVSMPVQGAGIYYISMNANSIPRDEVGVFKKILLTGYSVTGAELIRTRWQPETVKTSFSAAAIPEGEEAVMWVVETTEHAGSGGSYSPVTTPFGQVGSSRKKSTGIPEGYDFIVRAFNENSTPVEFINMPHFIAMGNPSAHAHLSNHKVVNAEITDWDPYTEATVATQTIAYSLKRGDPALNPERDGYYDTYTAYFYSPETDQWHLHARCKNAPIDPLDANTGTGACIINRGLARNRRTGDIPRTVDFKGWVYASDNKWYTIDTFIAEGVGKSGEPSSMTWRVNDAGNAFELSSTGFQRYPFTALSNVFSLSSPAALPAHLADKTADNFFQPALSVSLQNKVQMVVCEFAVVMFDFSGLDDQTEATLYWGTEDHLTYLETTTGTTKRGTYTYSAWEHSVALTVREGRNYTVLSGLESGKDYYYRIHAKNSSGQAFSDRTGRVTRLAEKTGTEVQVA